MALIDKLHDYKLRAFDNLDEPVMKTPTVDGTPGSTTYTYTATFETLVGETTEALEVSITNGPDTLSGYNRVRVWCEAPPPGVETVRFFKDDSGTFKLLGEADPDTPQIWDEGQSLTEEYPPATNDSGRPDWFLLLPHAKRRLQRSEMSDLQALLMKAIRNVADTIHKSGDVISGCGERSLGSDQWQFDAGVLYVDGFYVPIPASSALQLTASGTEKVGVIIEPIAITYTDDPVLRNPDEGVDWQYANPGMDRLGVQVSWVVDDEAAILVKEFIDGVPKTKTLPIERTELKRQLARQINDVSGSFVVRNFPTKIQAHPTDDTKVQLRISPGKAYPNGWEVELAAARTIDVPKARDYKFVDESTCDPFANTGGYTVGTEAENFDVDGLKIKLKVGSGNSHTVTFSGNGQTALQVAGQIEASVNAYPSSEAEDLVDCEDVSGKVKIAAVDGKTLTLETVSGDAYTELGLSTGSYTTTGTRIYQTNHAFVKDVSDISYGTELVETVVHNGVDHKDLLANENVYSIIGASDALVDCHDGAFDYHYGVDFGRTGNYIDFSLYGGSEPGNGATYYVKYRYNRLATKATRTLVRVIDAQITKGAEDGQDDIVYTSATSIKKVINGNDVSLSGSASDVVRILRINDSPGQSQTEYTSYSFLKNSDALEHDTSQVDWSEAGAQGEKPLGQPTTSATYYISFEVWYHEVEGDLVVADSYDYYEEIELAPDDSTELRDCLDFRTGGTWPAPDENPTFDYDFYLSRYDRVILNEYGDITRIEGEAAELPSIPREQSGAISISVLRLSPYTYALNEVQCLPCDTLRVTQGGIQELIRTVKELQYVVELNLHEQGAVDDFAAVEAKGFFVDALVGQARCDVAFDSNGVAFTAAVDPVNRCLRLPVETDVETLTIDEGSSTGFKRVGNTLTLDFTETLYQTQPRASRVLNLNPDEIFNYNNASMGLVPEVDVFMDKTQAPDLAVNLDQNLQGLLDMDPELAYQTTWGSWRYSADQTLTPDASNYLWWLNNVQGVNNNPVLSEDSWLADGIRSMRDGPLAHVERDGVAAITYIGQRTLDLGDRVIDISAVPQMRQIDIDVTCDALLPSVDYGIEIDGVACDFTATGSSSQGTDSYQGCTTVTADASGSLTGQFTIPEGIPVGTKCVKCVYADDPDTCTAMANFYSQGWRQTSQRTTVGYESVQMREETISEAGWLYVDPVAQTFIVDSGLQYICDVEVFFRTKSSTVPVTCEIRGVTNGYPDRRVFQSVTLQASSVSVSDDASSGTKFIFPNVVGFGPEEYAIVLLSNSNDYTVWASKLGEVDVITGDPIVSQPHGGVLFHSPNASTWVAEPQMDLKFNLYISNFQNNLQIVFTELTGLEASMLTLRVSELLQAPCYVAWSYSLDSGDSWIPFRPLLDTELASITTTVQILLDVTLAGGAYQVVEQWAGILIHLSAEDADYVSYRQTFVDQSNLPNSVQLYLDLDTDGTGGTGVRSVTPYFSIDDGDHWVQLGLEPDWTPISIGNGIFKEYHFETPGQASVSDASNTTPITITSTGHGYKEGAVVDIANVGGNTAANGTWRAVNVTDDDFDLVDPNTGDDSVGNGAYTSGGTIDMSEFDECRIRINLTTTNKARSPRVRRIRGNCA